SCVYGHSPNISMMLATVKYSRTCVSLSKRSPLKAPVASLISPKVYRAICIPSYIHLGSGLVVVRVDNPLPRLPYLATDVIDPLSHQASLAVVSGKEFVAVRRPDVRPHR